MGRRLQRLQRQNSKNRKVSEASGEGRGRQWVNGGKAQNPSVTKHNRKGSAARRPDVASTKTADHSVVAGGDLRSQSRVQQPNVKAQSNNQLVEKGPKYVDKLQDASDNSPSSQVRTLSDSTNFVSHFFWQSKSTIVLLRRKAGAKKSTNKTASTSFVGDTKG